MMTKTKYHVTKICEKEENDYTSTFNCYELALEYLGMIIRDWRQLKKLKVKKIIVEKVDLEWDEDSDEWDPEMLAEITGIKILHELLLNFD